MKLKELERSLTYILERMGQLDLGYVQFIDNLENFLGESSEVSPAPPKSEPVAGGIELLVDQISRVEDRLSDSLARLRSLVGENPSSSPAASARFSTPVAAY